VAKAPQLRIVDDDGDGPHALSELFHLRIPSVRSQVCGSGATGLEALARTPYKVVMSDLHMRMWTVWHYSMK